MHAHTDDAVVQALDAGAMSIDHGFLMKAETVKRIAKEGQFISPQAYIALSDPDANPALQNPIQIAKLRQVNKGAANLLKWAKQYGAKVARGTDIFGDEAFFDTMLREFEFRDPYFVPIEQLQQITGINAELLALSGLKNPYPDAPLGVIYPGAFADILLIDGDPTKDIKIMMKPTQNIKIIMKDGKIYKNAL